MRQIVRAFRPVGTIKLTNVSVNLANKGAGSGKQCQREGSGRQCQGEAAAAQQSRLYRRCRCQLMLSLSPDKAGVDCRTFPSPPAPCHFSPLWQLEIFKPRLSLPLAAHRY